MVFGQKRNPVPRPINKLNSKPIGLSETSNGALYKRFASDNASSNIEQTKPPKHIASVKWSFFIACLYAFFAAQFLSMPFVLIETDAQPLTDRLMENFFNGLEMARYILILGFAAKTLGRIANSMTVEPRIMCMINGALLGSMMMIGDMIFSQPITPLAFCFSIGGAFGGYMFWNARGCPTLTTRTS